MKLVFLVNSILFSFLLFLYSCDSTENNKKGVNPCDKCTEQEECIGNTCSLIEKKLYLVFSDSFLENPKNRISYLIKEVYKDMNIEIVNNSDFPQKISKDSIIISFGDNSNFVDIDLKSRLSSLDEESFIIKTVKFKEAKLYIALGNGIKFKGYELSQIGNIYAAYTLLEKLGFSFLHPLKVILPDKLNLTNDINISETPRWHKRGMHIHTMHPLELTNFLNGWGEDNAYDEDSWASMMPEWDLVLEWLVANRQNNVHWVLLEGPSWEEFSTSTLRKERLSKIVQRAHDYGLGVGIDVPIALEQQHAFRLVKDSEGENWKSEMEERIDWLMDIDFDYIFTETGTSEFTHSKPSVMLEMMNHLSIYLDETYQKRAAIKIHSSSGQTAEGYPDPITGEDINFNFLPHFADSRLGVLPHTVEFYSLDDPAPTYGNTDFSFIRDFMNYEAGSREVLWYPETAYWVSFDIDLPLFLPLYAERRVYDLKLIASDEDNMKTGIGDKKGGKIDGQFVFSSGWEWGYWLNDVIAARASWNPNYNNETSVEYMRIMLKDLLKNFGEVKDDLSDLIIDYAIAEENLLVLGKINGVGPDDINLRNGQAYMQGVETWDDVSDQADDLPIGGAQMTQPDRLGLVEMRQGRGSYSSEIEPLLNEMEGRFLVLRNRFIGLESRIPNKMLPFFKDFINGAKITYLRAKQIHGLYDYVDGYWDDPFKLDDEFQSWRMSRLNSARSALDEAKEVVADQENYYKVPKDRVISWSSGPTSYKFKYLWTVHSLYYWWRDEGKAVDSPSSPCYMNIIDPVDTSGNSSISILKTLGIYEDCVVIPSKEPIYPQDNLRDRP